MAASCGGTLIMDYDTTEEIRFLGMTMTEVQTTPIHRYDEEDCDCYGCATMRHKCLNEDKE